MVVTMGRKRRIVARKKSPRYVIRSISETRMILVYLRSPRMRKEPGEPRSARTPSSGRSTNSVGVGNAGSAGVVSGFMVDTSFLKDAGNHLIKRRILDAHIDDRVTIEDRAQHFGDPGAIDLEIDGRIGATDHFAKTAQVFRRRAAVEMELHQLGPAELFDDLGQWAIVNHFPMADDQHARAEGLDITHVMAGQEHRSEEHTS